MFDGVEFLHLALTIVVMLVFVIMAVFMLFMMFRALKAPGVYYPPKPLTHELVKELTCPKCGSPSA